MTEVFERVLVEFLDIVPNMNWKGVS